MPTPVTGRCNLHSGCHLRPAARRALSIMRASRAGAARQDRRLMAGDMTPLQSLPLKCAACGGREVELWLFVKRDEAEAWAEG